MIEQAFYILVLVVSSFIKQDPDFYAAALTPVPTRATSNFKLAEVRIKMSLPDQQIYSGSFHGDAKIQGDWQHLGYHGDMILQSIEPLMKNSCHGSLHTTQGRLRLRGFSAKYEN
jgi:hypothetical protein